jgi:chorismate lyase/3-hydroxybenzoate synthase
LSSPQVASSAVPGGLPGMDYRRLGADEPLPSTALCAISFGAQRATAQGSQALSIHLNLPVLVGTGLTELWHTDARVEAGREGRIHFASGGHFLAGRVEIDEQAAGGLEAAAAEAYDAISHFTTRSRHRHLLRMYNYFSGINSGSGDAERYKLFCSGRAAGLQGLKDAPWPAASAVGRQDHSSLLQVYWLAGSEPGRAIENPRQVSAFNYPRQYGPAPPSFSRAMLVTGGLLISGTGSILGHASHHAHDLPAQLDEILRNLASLRLASGGPVPLQSGRGTLLKIYLRDAAAAGLVSAYLRAHLPSQVQFLVLGADICRRELVVEIDAAHFGTAA